jgi:hypothetical protein
MLNQAGRADSSRIRRHRGQVISRMIWSRLAPYTRLTVTSSCGTDCTAAMPPMISTKMVVKTPKAIFCGMLTPNIRMNTGRKIDLGTPNRKLTRGRNSAPSTGTSARRSR